jgi:hypothetical protein
MTRQQPNFWDLIQADRVRYFGPNPPRPPQRDPLTDLLGADSPASSPATSPDEGNARSSNPLEELAHGALSDALRGDRPMASMPGMFGPTGHTPMTGLAPLDMSGLPPTLPIDLPPIGDMTADDAGSPSPVGPSFDSSVPPLPSAFNIDSLGAAMSAAANQVPPLGQSAASEARDVLPLLPGIDLPQFSHAAPRFEHTAEASSAGRHRPAANAESSSSGADQHSAASSLPGPPPGLIVNLGPDHRLAESVLQSVSHKMERLVFDHARHEVERGFHIYQANLRALFPTTRGSG